MLQSISIKVSPSLNVNPPPVLLSIMRVSPNTVQFLLCFRAQAPPRRKKGLAAATTAAAASKERRIVVSGGGGGLGDRGEPIPSKTGIMNRGRDNLYERRFLQYSYFDSPSCSVFESAHGTSSAVCGPLVQIVPASDYEP